MEKLIPPIYKTLTKTMIEKGNPDCWAELATFARLFGVDFDALENGQRIEVPLAFTDGSVSVIRFYRVTGKGGRQDKRYNIPAADLRAQASVGDTIAFTFKIDKEGQAMICANVTRQPDFTYLVNENLNVTNLEVKR